MRSSSSNNNRRGKAGATGKASAKATANNSNKPPQNSVNLTRTQRRNQAAVEREKQRKIELEKKRIADAAAAKLAAEEAAKKAKEDAKLAAEAAAKAAAQAREDEIKQLTSTVADMAAAETARREARAANEEDKVRASRSAWSKNKRKLKSDLKKTTALMKKLKNFTATSAAGICGDLAKLNFSRFASEGAVALSRSEIKGSDLEGLVQVASFLHQRYGDFTEPFLEGVMAVFAGKGGGDDGGGASNQKRQRTALRLICKLLVSGIMPEPRTFMKIMRSITGATLVAPPVASQSVNPFGESEEESSDEDSSDAESDNKDDDTGAAAAASKTPAGPTFTVALSAGVLAFMPMVIAVAKYEGADFLGIPSETTQRLFERAAALEVDASALAAFTSDPMLPPQMVAKMCGMTSAYFDAVAEALVQVHTNLSAKEKKAHTDTARSSAARDHSSTGATALFAASEAPAPELSAVPLAQSKAKPDPHWAIAVDAGRVQSPF